MAGKACIGAFLLLFVAISQSALVVDEDVTNNLISAAGSARNGGEVAIVFQGPHGRIAKKEELLQVRGEEDDYAKLYYTRKSNKISLEILHQGSLKSVSWSLNSKREPRDSLILVASSNRVKLFAGCSPLHWHAMKSRDLLEFFSHREVKVFHEQSSPIEIYGDEKSALEAINCEAEFKHPSLTTVDETDVEEVKDFIDNNRRKREEEMQGDDYRTNYIDANGILPQTTTPTQRGDIPSSGIETCDDEVIRQLQLLRQTIDGLRREVADQKGTIDNLRSQLRQCCHRVPAPVERCAGNSCYPGY